MLICADIFMLSLFDGLPRCENGNGIETYRHSKTQQIGYQIAACLNAHKGSKISEKAQPVNTNLDKRARKPRGIVSSSCKWPKPTDVRTGLCTVQGFQYPSSSSPTVPMPTFFLGPPNQYLDNLHPNEHECRTSKWIPIRTLSQHLRRSCGFGCHRD